jgi:gliding-associated putative ABC transporter substrate-binding component GldG
MAVSKNLRKGLGSLTAVPLVIAIVIAINLIGVFLFARFDLTSAGLYSLSEASRQLAGSLDDPVVVKLYFSEDLPAPYNANARYLKDQLAEYRVYSGGQLRYEFIDPMKTDREREAQALGIPPMQVNAYEKDKIELKKVYMGVAFLYEDKREVIPVVQSTRNLEYEISSAIQKVTSKIVPTAGFLTGHGETDLSNQMQTAAQALSQLYQVERVSVTPGKLIDSSIATLLICGPTDSVSAWDQYAIDQFIMRGGKLAVFYDPVATDLQQQTAQDRQTNWPEFLAHYGVRFLPGLVIDARCGQIAIMQQQGYIRYQNVVDFPFLPQVVRFNPGNLIGKDLEGVTFPFVSALDSTLADTLGYSFVPICWSSEHSGVRQTPYYLSPTQTFGKTDFNRPGQILAAAITGAFATAFPQGPPPDARVQAAVVPPVLKQAMDNRLVAVGDADFCTEQGSRTASNLAFLLNVVDWLTKEGGLISIRSRAVTSRPLAEVSDGTRQLVKYANVFGPPLLVVLVGVWRWQMRRRAKRG